MKKEGAVVVHDGLGLEVGKAVMHMERRNGIGAGDFTNEIGDERGENTIVGRLKITQANLQILKLFNVCSEIAKPDISLDPQNGLGLEELVSL